MNAEAPPAGRVPARSGRHVEEQCQVTKARFVFVAIDEARMLRVVHAVMGV